MFTTAPHSAVLRHAVGDMKYQDELNLGGPSTVLNDTGFVHVAGDALLGLLFFPTNQNDVCFAKR